jgi:hypothetical protein
LAIGYLLTNKTVRYHLQLLEGRTTISLDKIISDLMAIKLGNVPRTKEAHMAVRKQLESFIAHDLGRSGRGLGEYITEKSVLFITDKIISEKHGEWWNEQYDKGLL